MPVSQKFQRGTQCDSIPAHFCFYKRQDKEWDLCQTLKTFEEIDKRRSREELDHQEIFTIMFQRATCKIVKEIDPDGNTLIPASSTYYSDILKPLYIVRKKRRVFFSTKNKYILTRIRLVDILKDGGDLNFGLQSSSFSCYSRQGTISASGDIGVSGYYVDAGVHASGAKTDIMPTVEMVKRTISENTLHEVVQTRKVDRGNSFVKQLMGDILYVISEVVETNQKCSLTTTSMATTGVGVLLQMIRVKGGVAANMNEKLSFPAGTTIAFKVSKLRITQDDTLEMIWKESKLLCFLAGKFVSNFIGSNSPWKADIPLTELAKLPKDISLLILDTFREILRTCDYVPDLEIMLDQMCESLQPDLHVLELMEDENRACVEKLLGLMGIRMADPPGQPLTLTPHQNGIITTAAIFIQALNELNADTLNLLATSVEMKITSRQLKLLERIEESFFLMGMHPVENLHEAEEILEALALQLTDTEFEITQWMLQDFGFHLRRENASISLTVHDQDADTFFRISAVVCILSALDK